MNKSNIVALLHRSQLKLFIQGNGKEAEEVFIDFPEDTVSKSDIFDQVKFSFDIKNQLIKRPELRGSTILFLLPGEKVFSKLVGLDKTNLETQKSKFFAESPFTEEESNFIVYSKNKAAQFLAVPKKLITDIENSFSKIGFKVVFLPLAQLFTIGLSSKEKNLVAYNLDDHYNLLLVEKNTFPSLVEVDYLKEKEAGVLSAIEKIKENNPDLNAVILLDKDSPLKESLRDKGFKVGLVPVAGNFNNIILKVIGDSRRHLQEYLFGSEIGRTSRKIPIRGMIIALLTVLLVGILFPIFFIFKGIGEKQNLPVKNIQVSTSSAGITASTSATPTLTITPTPVSKADLKLKILNGNRIPGDAARLEKRLNALGFTNSETDTADKQGNHDTTIKLSSKVTAEFKAELQKAVEADYVTVVFGTDPADRLDIEILTGSRK